MKKEGIGEKGERQILVFSLANDELGLDISCVREVLRPQEIHPLPQAPNFIEGVINLRGHIIAVIDLRKRLTVKEIEDRSKMRIIVCKIKRFIVGLVVNSVSEIIAVSEENIGPTPEVVSMQIEADFMSGIARLGERIIVILDLENILTREEITKLSKIEQ